MSHGRLAAHASRRGRFAALPVPLLLLVFVPHCSRAQRAVEASSTASLAAPAVSMSTVTTRSSSSATAPPRSMTTSFAASSTANSTASSVSSTKTEDTTPQLFPGADQPNTQHMRTENVFNYYFLFLALFGVLVALFLWWLHKRRKRRKEQMRLSGQHALARDLDGWVNTRRWFHGTWRHNQTTAFVRREEGLNEDGEAPPPYQPKSEVTVGHEAGAAQDPASGLAIPLRTLSRDEIEQSRPPEYRETISRGGTVSTRPDTATTRTIRPETANSPPRSSTRDLLREQGRQ